MKDIDNPRVQQIIGAGRILFWKFGIRKVTVEEICQEAGVSKMTFYKYFPNKVELARYILDRLTSEALQTYEDIIKASEPFPDKVRKLIDIKIQAARSMSNEFMQDLLQLYQNELSAFYHQRMQQSIDMTMRFLSDARKKGDIRRDMNLKFALYFLNHMVEMVQDSRLLNLYGSAEELIIELTHFFFYGISHADRTK